LKANKVQPQYFLKPKIFMKDLNLEVQVQMASLMKKNKKSVQQYPLSRQI
jgi:hypothetical protein